MERTEKIPISVSPEWKQEIEELGSLLGINSDQYGWLPRIFKFSITYTLKGIQRDEKIIPDLEAEKMTLLFSSITKLKSKRELLEKASELQKQAEKV